VAAGIAASHGDQDILGCQAAMDKTGLDQSMRRGIVLGVVLGEDEGLPADVQRDFRASGLYHLLRR
jgi:hypothetical protein